MLVEALRRPEHEPANARVPANRVLLTVTISLAVKQQVPPVADANTAPLAPPTSGLLTASIALYPDPLLGAVLAAATLATRGVAQ